MYKEGNIAMKNSKATSSPVVTRKERISYYVASYCAKRELIENSTKKAPHSGASNSYPSSQQNNPKKEE